MTTAKVIYLGELRTECIHVASGEKIITDAPVDNHGKGAAFSPTDLTATSLGTCMLTTMAIKAAGKDIQIIEMSANLLKVMASNPRRIAEIHVEARVRIEPNTLENRRYLEDIGLNCPVAKSLHPDIIQDISFEWG